MISIGQSQVIYSNAEELLGVVTTYIYRQIQLLRRDYHT
jgi:hypothetical protein